MTKTNLQSKSKEFYLYNTLTREKAIFKPLVADSINMYVCGMTVYDSCHLGHGRVMVAFDTIVRYMRFLGYKVKYVRNITDVDDKIINRARENGESISSLTLRVIKSMHAEEKLLGNLPPDVEPKATQHIQEILDLIKILLDKDYAYIGANNDIYFKVRKFADYGKLSGRNLDELLAGARIEVEQAKRDALDFVLWKSAKPEEPQESKWQTPWGEGRPGWHIECSAMSSKHLGKTFDIHGGGPDLVFPHHENEIAQSEAAHSTKFVNYWMHVGALRVNNEKMSKSLGNFQTLAQVMQKHKPETLRYFFISSHYRSPINYTEDSLYDAEKALSRLYNALVDIDYTSPLSDEEQEALGTLADKFIEQFHTAMRDDFNTPKALASLFGIAKLLNTHKSSATISTNSSLIINALAKTLYGLGSILGILTTPNFLTANVDNKKLNAASTEVIEQLIAKRKALKQARDYAGADSVREQLQSMGVNIKDNRDGTTSWTLAD